MNYILVYSSNTEVNSKLAEAKLKNAGIDVKTDYSLGYASNVMKPVLFGVYVTEAELEKAKALLAISEMPIKNPNAYVGLQVAVVFLLIAIGIFLYIKSQIQ